MPAPRPTRGSRAERLELIARLAAGVAHDFNNLLMVITVNAQGLARFTSAASDERALQDILFACERATSLTRQLLAFARRSPSEARSVDVAEVVLASERLLRHAVGARVAFVLDIDPDAGVILADPGEIEQITGNLVLNARDAMPDGGTLEVSVQREVTSVGPRVVLRVSDTGTGIDPAALPHIFEPLFTTKEPGKGTGLGLSIVRDIAERWHGELSVESSVGRGARFRVAFPALAAAASVPRPAPALGRGRVLVIDDDVTVREVVERMLRDAGYTPITAGDPGAALDVVRRVGDQLEAVVTDVSLGVGSGIELGRRLVEAQPGLGVLYMSGYMADVTVQDLLATGAAFIAKPFDGEELLAKLAEAMDRPNRRRSG